MPREPFERTVHDFDYATANDAASEKLRRHHGHNRERDKGREGHRSGDGNTELAEQTAEIALHIRDGQKHRHQHQGGCDNREADFLAAINACD
jgi:hypothetical protein